MLVMKFKVEMMEKLDYKLNLKLVPGVAAVLINMSKLESM